MDTRLAWALWYWHHECLKARQLGHLDAARYFEEQAIAVEHTGHPFAFRGLL